MIQSKFIKQIYLFLFILFLFSGFGHIHPAEDIIALKAYLNALKTDPDLHGASWSFALRDLENDELIASYHADQQLIPASLIKLITTGEALRILGPEKEFKTKLAYSGIIDDEGVLHGNIYIVGAGDPAFGSQKISGYKDWPEKVMLISVKEIQRAGIKQIDGDIIGDASVYADNLCPGSWSFEDMGNYYAAAATGLTYADNSYTIHFSSGPAGSPATVTYTEPEITDLLLINEVKAAKRGSGDQAYVHAAPLSNKQIIRGTIPPNRSDFTIKAALPNPPLFAARQLYHLLEEKAVSISGSAKSLYQARKEHVRVFYTYPSLKLKDIVKWTNQHSDNLFAEHCLKQIALYKKSQASTDNGIRAIMDDLKASSLNTGDLWMHDGSGLSRSNSFSAAFLTAYLNQIYHSAIKESFWGSLPVAGQSGTLRYLMKNTAADGNIFAKSGNLQRVRTYAGYVNTLSGRIFSFCIMANNFSCSSRMIRDKWVQLMILIAKI